MDLLDLLEAATVWTGSKVGGTKPDQLELPTPCESWDVRALLNHLLDVLEMFEGVARGGSLRPPHNPPDLIGDDTTADFSRASGRLLAAFRAPGVMDKTAPWLGGQVPMEQMVRTVFGDVLIHGWDLATATGQDATMPSELAEAAWEQGEGGIPDMVRGSIFANAVEVPERASAQDKLIAYTGRTP
jgi:uncharacterized protein (TIGR03086 family)